MKIVHSWLLDLCPGLPDDTEAIADALSDLGLAVESVDRVGSAVEGVITAKVLRTERHPDAAKVHRVYVDAGDGVERQLHCCRVAAGDRDALGVDQMRAVRLGQAVRPVVVESMIGAEVDDDAWG